MSAEGKKYEVTHVRQNEINDIFMIKDKRTGKIDYDEYPRSMGQTCENILAYLDDDEKEDTTYTQEFDDFTDADPGL